MLRSNFLTWSQRFFCGLAVIVSSTMVLGALPDRALAQSAASPMKIGVVGSGNIGSTVGSLWVKAGHQVIILQKP